MITLPAHPISKRLVTTDWLAANLGAPGLVVLDGSYYLPAMKRDATAEYLAGHIPGAIRFDIDEVADHAIDLPHMLPSPESFAAAVGKLGIGDRDIIVAYDGHGMFSSPRVWFTFRLFGADNVYILEGGLPKWKAEGRPLESGPAAWSCPRRPLRRTSVRRCGRLARSRPADARLAQRSGGRRAARRALSRRGARAAAGRALRPYAGLLQRAIDYRGEGRPAAAAAGAAAGLYGRGCRPRQTRHHELRLGCVGRDPVARARRARQASRRHSMTAVVVGTRGTDRFADRDGAGVDPWSRPKKW